MDTRRSTTALRPSKPAGAARTNSLKRTISKCGLDAGGSANALSGLAAKKLAPLQESFQPKHQPEQQQQHQQHQLAVYVDDGEPVLLPRDAPPFAMDDEDLWSAACAHEYSPVGPLCWDDSPLSAKQRYYESLLESSSATFVSPSPQHVLYAYTLLSGHSAGSTISFGGSHDSPMEAHQRVATTGVANGQEEAVPDREYLSAANLHAIMLSYLDEMFQYYDLARSFTFGRVSEMVQSVPFAFKYIQGLVKYRLGISGHLVGSFVQNVLSFICDEDIRDASVKEFAEFLRSIQQRLYEATPPRNIFVNLGEFFQDVLVKFKKYLIQKWLAVQRIQFPCEFGKKSDSLFLCMDCHREHL